MFKRIRLLDTNSDRYIDALYAVLMMTPQTQFFPELYEIFGRQNVLKFMSIFSGQKIQVPPIEFIEQQIQNVQIWLMMKRDSSSRMRVINEYGVEDKMIDTIVRNVDTKMAELGIKVEAE